MIITSNSSILTNKTSNNLFSKLQAIKHKLATMMLTLVFFALSSLCWSVNITYPLKADTGKIIVDGEKTPTVENIVQDIISTNLFVTPGASTAPIRDAIVTEIGKGDPTRICSEIHKAIATAIDSTTGAYLSMNGTGLIQDAVDARVATCPANGKTGLMGKQDIVNDIDPALPSGGASNGDIHKAIAKAIGQKGTSAGTGKSINKNTDIHLAIEDLINKNTKVIGALPATGLKTKVVEADSINAIDDAIAKNIPKAGGSVSGANKSAIPAAIETEIAGKITSGEKNISIAIAKSIDTNSSNKKTDIDKAIASNITHTQTTGSIYEAIAMAIDGTAGKAASNGGNADINKAIAAVIATRIKNKSSTAPAQNVNTIQEEVDDRAVAVVLAEITKTSNSNVQSKTSIGDAINQVIIEGQKSGLNAQLIVDSIISKKVTLSQLSQLKKSNATEVDIGLAIIAAIDNPKSSIHQAIANEITNTNTGANSSIIHTAVIKAIANEISATGIATGNKTPNNLQAAIVEAISPTVSKANSSIHTAIIAAIANEISPTATSVNAAIAHEISPTTATIKAAINSLQLAKGGGTDYAKIAEDIHPGSTGAKSGAIRQAIVDEITDTNSTIHKAIANEISATATNISQAVDARVTAVAGAKSKKQVSTPPSGKIIPQNTPQIQQAAVSILPPTEPKQIAAKVTQHVTKGTALHTAATTKFPNDKAKQDDYLMPDSSNSKVIASNQAGNHIITHVNNRIANRSPSVASAPTAKSIKGISSGAIADNLQIWMSAGYQHTREKEQSQTDHSKIEATVFSLGLDTDVDDHATLGVSYANVKSKVDSYGPAKADKASDDIKTNAVSIYLAITEAVKQSSVAVIYAHNKHDGVDAHKKIKSHTSNVVGANYSCDYSFKQHGKVMPGIILSGQLAVMSVKVNSHQNKFTGVATASNCTPKQQNVIFNFGVATTFIKHQQFKNDTQVTTKMKIGYSYVISSGDNSHKIELAANNPASRVKVKAKEPSANNFNLGLNFDFVVSRNMHIDLDLQYSLGDSAQAYGASLVARYHF